MSRAGDILPSLTDRRRLGDSRAARIGAARASPISYAVANTPEEAGAISQNGVRALSRGAALSDGTEQRRRLSRSSRGGGPTSCPDRTHEIRLPTQTGFRREKAARSSPCPGKMVEIKLPRANLEGVSSEERSPIDLRRFAGYRWDRLSLPNRFEEFDEASRCSISSARAGLHGKPSVEDGVGSGRDEDCARKFTHRGDGPTSRRRREGRGSGAAPLACGTSAALVTAHGGGQRCHPRTGSAPT